jgi:hypothetical protein
MKRKAAVEIKAEALTVEREAAAAKPLVKRGRPIRLEENNNVLRSLRTPAA